MTPCCRVRVPGSDCKRRPAGRKPLSRRTAQLVVLSKPIFTEIKNLSSIQFSANIEMYLGFRLRAAEKLVQAFPHGPQNLPALVTVLHDFVFAVRDILLFMGKTIVQSLEQPRNSSAPLPDGAPSKGAVAAAGDILPADRGCGPRTGRVRARAFRLARTTLCGNGQPAEGCDVRTAGVRAALAIASGRYEGECRCENATPGVSGVAQCSSSSEPKPSILSSMPFCRSAHQ